MAEKMEAIGFTFHSIDGGYWDESARYCLTAGEVDQIEAAAKRCHDLALEVLDRTVQAGHLERLGLDPAQIALVEKSWQRRDPSIYGRFDFSWTPGGEPKLLEYNADTPTSLLEASVAQWYWLEEVLPGADQFNRLHEALVEAWTDYGQRIGPGRRVVFSAAADSEEDGVTLHYLADTARQAGLGVDLLAVEDLGWHDGAGRFVDLAGTPIDHWFKLYPWEWLTAEAFAPHLARNSMSILEPAWKLALSSKAILVLLHEAEPRHPHLLAASLDRGSLSDRAVSKPFFGREGANVVLPGQSHTDGPYGDQPRVFQEPAPLPVFAGRHTVAGAWIVNGQAAGLGFREDDGPVTRDTSRFVPHYFR